MNDRITVTEALVALLVERPDVDATNAIGCLRAAQQRVLRAGFGQVGLHEAMTWDEVDALIIAADARGDLFGVVS